MGEAHPAPSPEGGGVAEHHRGLVAAMPQALAGVDFADSYEIDQARRVATRQLNRKAKPWVWGRPPKPPRHRRRILVYRL